MQSFTKQLIFVALGVVILVVGGALVFGRTKSVKVGGFGATTTATCDIDPASCVNSGLVGYWDFDEMGGTTARDKSGNGNTGTLGGGTAAYRPSWSQGVQPLSGGKPGGGALKFDGVNDYVDAGNEISLNINPPMTYAAWIKPHDYGGDIIYYFLTKGSGSSGINFGVSRIPWTYLPAKSLLLANGSFCVYTPSAITFDAWNHVAFTNNGTVTKLYINGVERASGSQTLINASGINQLIGKRSDYGNYGGLIDDVRIYNRALSEAEIRYLYNQGRPIAHWKFDEGSGSYAYDSSGNANTGTLTNMSTTTAWVNGAFGTALQFDGSDDYVAVSTSISMATGTLSFWLKPNTTTEKIMQLNATNSVEISSGAVSVTGFGTPIVYVDGKQTTTFPDTNWHHITIVSSVGITANAVNFGKISSNYGNVMLDDVRIYNYARTPEQIKQDYNAGKAVYVGKQQPDCDASPADCINKGLVGYWDFDEMGGTTATDKSGNGNTGTLGGGTAAYRPTWSQGVQPLSGGKPGGGALKFDGVDDYVNAGNGSSLQAYSEFSVSAWVYQTSETGQYDWIVDKGGNTSGAWGVSIQNASDEIWIFRNGGSVYWDTDITVQKNKWLHLVFVKNSSNNAWLYIDGVQKASTTGFIVNAASGLSVAIGAWLNGPTHYFNGLIDDVRIYNRALSEAEIRYLYNQGRPIAHWKFDEGADTATTCNATISTVYDYSGNANHGTLYLGGSPATSTAWTDGKYGCALQFDGSDDYVLMGSNIIGTSAITYCAWINPTGWGENSKGRIGDNSQFVFWLDNSGGNRFQQVRFSSNDGSNDVFSPNYSITLNIWQHVCAVRDSTGAKVH